MAHKWKIIAASSRFDPASDSDVLTMHVEVRDPANADALVEAVEAVVPLAATKADIRQAARAAARASWQRYKAKGDAAALALGEEGTET